MPKRFHRFEMKLLEEKYKKYLQAAKKQGCTLKQFFTSAADEFLNPIRTYEQQPENDEIAKIRVELTKMRDELFDFDREIPMGKVAAFGATELSTQKQIIHLLEKSPGLDIFEIAEKLTPAETPDFVFAVMSFLKSTKKVYENRTDMKWYLCQKN
ncbi:hypothetical protein [Candidatus Lokiarchaeum ossiferum]|uniref:hypothetical protein n=1 Tax=Candidatus Lokiarchaeum ossiferum TaxID=2951803 RepID=UPI00352C5637